MIGIPTSLPGVPDYSTTPVLDYSTGARPDAGLDFAHTRPGRRCRPHRHPAPTSAPTAPTPGGPVTARRPERSGVDVRWRIVTGGAESGRRKRAAITPARGEKRRSTACVADT
ncbi:hypothetical protein Q0Z83_055910 [Actinoplanes sichuanensis]|nr:hypothetical protein Q0Z83_055910 [Actinoplanes sichuanensis]